MGYFGRFVKYLVVCPIMIMIYNDNCVSLTETWRQLQMSNDGKPHSVFTSGCTQLELWEIIISSHLHHSRDVCQMQLDYPKCPRKRSTAADPINLTISQQCLIRYRTGYRGQIRQITFKHLFLLAAMTFLSTWKHYSNDYVHFSLFVTLLQCVSTRHFLTVVVVSVLVQV